MIKQEQRFVMPMQIQSNIIQGTVPRRLLTSCLVGLVVTLLLALIEIIFLLLINPAHVLGMAGNRFFALVALPIHAPQSLLVLLIELVLSSLGVFFAAKPLALVAYLLSVHRAQEEYHKLYTPLTALSNLRKAAEPYQEYDTTPTVYAQDQQVSILDLVQQQDTHQLILGVPGAGKTMALRVFQYIASQHFLLLVFKRGRIPVYVPMKNYSLFLKKQQAVLSDEDPFLNLPDLPQATLFEYLYENDLPGMRYLRPLLLPLSQQGRLLLLCDGLNEIDSNYLSQVSGELVQLMRQTDNRLVMTCREVDYREQPDFIQLVDEGQAARAVIYPLQPEQISEFVERYVERQDHHWKHTAGQIMQVIDRSRLRYHCTNPMMLFTLMGIIDKIGIERGKQVDTRGRLLRESVTQLIGYEQRQPKWNRVAPAEQDVISFLSEIACAARWANDRNAIQLRVSSPALVSGEGMRPHVSFEELADELQFWLDEHPAQSPFGVDPDAELHEDVPQLLQFALSAALIDISPSGVLSFRHELIAEYFVAEYFFASANKKQAADLPIREELLENVGRWSEPIAIWAGLLDKPLLLAERFGQLGLNNPAYVLQALALGLVCVGVLWTPPQAEVQRIVLLPPALEEALSVAVRNRGAREELARIFTRCAEEGGQEVYRSLLPLLMVEGVDELLALLDQTIVPELLFTHLQDAVDNIAYEAQVKRLARVLGRFGSVVVDRATQLSLPAAERSPRLRAAVINILGGTNDPRAVEALVARLRDTETFIVERATNALLRLGPPLTLIRVLQELEQRTPDQYTLRVHWAALIILGRFLDEQDLKRQVSLMQYQRILEVIVAVLTSNYQNEPEVQQKAREILVKQARNTTNEGVQDNRGGKAIETLMRYLPSQNDVAAHNVIVALQEIGSPATSSLVEMLHHPSEMVRVRVIDILQTVRDLQALLPLLSLVNDPAASVQQQVAYALRLYAPESVPGLIDLVLTGPDDFVADQAAHILAGIGVQAVVPTINVLFEIVPGRTRFLVQVLERIHDPQAVPALIKLLQMPQLDALLAIASVRALGQFTDERVVQPLLASLASANPLLYEESINALSQLGSVALDGLISALDGEQETLVTQRVRRAILGMLPFPGEQLISALEKSSALQTEQIMHIFRMQGPDAATILVKNMLHSDEYVQNTIHETLEQMPGPIVVPALLDVLDQPAMRKVASTFLLKYPDAAIFPLVELLGEHERGASAAAILPQFGSTILSPLLVGLDDQRSMAREMAQRIIVTLVRQSAEPSHVLQQVVQLFNPSPPDRARTALLGVLTNELADVSLPNLLEGLEDAYLIDDMANALTLLARRTNLQNAVLDDLLQCLYFDERRRGAETSLISIGAPAVTRVGALITDPQPLVARSARQILREIGVPALPLIWSAHSDKDNAARRAAAMEVFHGMRTEVIKDELVSLLVSHKRDDIAMAVSLLLERIHDESIKDYADRVMVPELIEYVQTHTDEETNLRIISLLLLLGEDAVIDHLVQVLDEYPQHRRQLTYALLLLGKKTHGLLLEMFLDPATSVALQADLAALLAMVDPSSDITQYALNINKYGLSVSQSNVTFPDELSIALHALGGLLAGGQWNVRKLQSLRDASKEGDFTHELCNVLLGWRYEPQIAKLQGELDNQKDTLRKELLAWTTRIATEQKRAQTLETELEHVREEHGSRGDELKQVQRDKDALRANVDQLVKEKTALRTSIEQLSRERTVLQNQLERIKLDYQALLRQSQYQAQQPNNSQIR